MPECQFLGQQVLEQPVPFGLIIQVWQAVCKTQSNNGPQKRLRIAVVAE